MWGVEYPCKSSLALIHALGQRIGFKCAHVTRLHPPRHADRAGAHTSGGRAAKSKGSRRQGRTRAKTCGRSRRFALKSRKRRRSPPTFEEYLCARHIFLSKPFRVQTDKSFSTQGSITNPKNNRCPTLLKPLTDFPRRHTRLEGDCCRSNTIWDSTRKIRVGATRRNRSEPMMMMHLTAIKYLDAASFRLQ